MKQREGKRGMEGKRDGPERNRTEQGEKAERERSSQTGMSSTRLSILSQSEKNSLA